MATFSLLPVNDAVPYHIGKANTVYLCSHLFKKAVSKKKVESETLDVVRFSLNSIWEAPEKHVNIFI